MYYSLTPYNYCGNNPLISSDPLGLASYYCSSGVFSDDGVDDGLRYALPDDCSVTDYFSDGKFDYKALRENSFLMPDDESISDYMNDYNAAVQLGLPYAEAGGVVASKYDSESGKVIQKYFSGGVNYDKPRDPSQKGNASEQVKKGLNDARQSGFVGIDYYAHTHPYETTNSPIKPSNQDRSTSLNNNQPGFVANNKGACFYFGPITATIPIQVFIDIKAK